MNQKVYISVDKCAGEGCICYERRKRQEEYIRRAAFEGSNTIQITNNTPTPQYIIQAPPRIRGDFNAYLRETGWL